MEQVNVLRFLRIVFTIAAIILLVPLLTGCGVHTGWGTQFQVYPINEVTHEQKLVPPPQKTFRNRDDD